MAPVSKRDTIKKALLKLTAWINNADENVPLVAAEKALSQLNVHLIEFDDIHEEILAVCGKSEIDFQRTEGNSVIDTVNVAREKLEMLIETIKIASSEPRNSHDKSTSSASGSSTSETKDDPPPPNLPSTSKLTTSSTAHPDSAINVTHNKNNAMRDIMAKRSARSIHTLMEWIATATEQNTTSNAVLARKSLLEENWSSYNASVFSDWNDETNVVYDHVEDEYLTAMEGIFNLMELLNPSPTLTAHNNNIAAKSEVPLPRIEIPKFSGDFLSWPSFHDVYTSMVHNSTSLSGVQKMHYLRTCVDGEAAHLIRSYNVTEANYAEAWATLCARYNNKRLIINAHLEKLFNQPKPLAESAGTIRKQLDTFTEAVRSLNALKQPVQHWDSILVFTFMSKTDSSTKHAWEMSLVNDNVPTFDQLSAFIERRCRSLEAANVSSPSTHNKVQQKPTNHQRPSTSSAYYATTNTNRCPKCAGDHTLGSCPGFIRIDQVDRYKEAKRLNVCYNCLRLEHTTNVCTAGSCRKCNGRHHTLLHYENQRPPTNNNTLANNNHNAPTNNTNNNTQKNAALVGTNNNKLVLLATAVAYVKISFGTHCIRALLDTGSQSSFITERCVQRVGLKRSKANIAVSGLGNKAAEHTRGVVNLEIQSTHDSTHQHHLQAFILQNITNMMPNETLDISTIPFLADVPTLADPNFNRPGEIDVLFGADILGELMCEGRIHDDHTKALFAQNTTLGWVISGPIPQSHARKLHTLVSLVSHIQLDAALERFWDLEEIGPSDMRTAEELACESHFAATHLRMNDGRYVVELPIRDGVGKLGNSKAAALKSFEQLERRFAKQSTLREQYTNFINEYITLGHMTRIHHEVDEHKAFYLPHHSVTKASSTSTKLRVVFDASRRTTSGLSLNETLMVGPKLQGDLVDLLLRFRSHAVVFCGDLVKMYRQIRTKPDSSEYQRILWRSSTHENICTYRLDTVTYGTASASYLATKALQQLAADEAHQFPLASAATMTDFYMDDLMTGCDDISAALALQNELIKLMRAGGFTLSKWASNANELLTNVPENQREIGCPLEIHTDDSIKALGVAWNPSSDCFQYRITLPNNNSNQSTKRIILSEVASLFDPLGLLGPIIVSAKIFIQLLWAEGLEWDQPIPVVLAERWQKYRNTLTAIHEINIPRWLGMHRSNTYEIHGFCDASEAAYAAVAYMRATHPNGDITVHIITARTKVAPIKRVSLPRLELCGALLLAKLMAHIKSALNQPDINCRAWCDSTVTLAWIRKPSHVWHTFVSNRVSKIQSLTSPQIWHHVPSEENPADLASRGVLAPVLANSTLWWHGPIWLGRSDQHWPRTNIEFSTKIDIRPSVTSLHTKNDNHNELLRRFSSLHRLQRVTAYVRRFIGNCRTLKASRAIGCLTTIELHEALQHWIRSAQSTAFTNDITKIRNGKYTSTKHLASLNPILDESGILRVGGRIHNARLPYNVRHPIIIPKDCHLDGLLVAAAHQNNMHSGPQLTVAALRQKYWVIAARRAVKKHIHRCTVCIRYKHTLGKQLMAPLPERRTIASRPFLSAGVDYAGPITIKLQPGRGTKTSKAYVALFVCFATRAIHLELVSSLATDTFLAAFRRFVARRGKCADLHSDCGTNFIGADKELRLLHNEVKSQLKNSLLADELAADGTQWHFNPPGAPSFGGIWEAGVKSAKHHLRRTFGTSLLTFEELYTILTQIEAILNSRPIWPMTDDIDDLQPLTPGHFLIGEAMNAVPEPVQQIDDTPPHRRWQYMQHLTQQFWLRWRKEYITSLQQRNKWLQRVENISIGTLALIADETLPPAKWALGRVVEIHPGADGLVRVVTLRHRSGLVKRPICKLVIFPNLTDNQST